MRGESNIKDDKIRILTTLARQLAVSTSESRKAIATALNPNRTPEPFEVGAFITFTTSTNRVQVGDFVMCNTSGVHDFTFGFVHTIFNDYEMMIREIGSNRLCRIGNESFAPIKGLRENDLLEGLKYEFRNKIIKTLARYGDDWRRFSHIEFLNDQYANVFVREKFGGIRNPTAPFPIKIQWNRKRISLKLLFSELEAGGYSTRAFEPKEEKLPPIGTPMAAPTI